MFHVFGHLLITLGGAAACAVMVNEFRARWRDAAAALRRAGEGKENWK